MRRSHRHSTLRVVGAVLVTLALACVVLFSVVRVRIDVTQEPVDFPAEFEFAHAVATGRSEAEMKTLLARDPRAVDRPGINGSFPIHSAAGSADPVLLMFLIDNGADPNQRSSAFIDLGGTALHVAVDSAIGADGITARHEETIALLHAHGADTVARDEAGRTPIDLAREAGADQIIELLEDLGLGVQEANQHPRESEAHDVAHPLQPPVSSRIERQDRQGREDE